MNLSTHIYTKGKTHVTAELKAANTDYPYMVLRFVDEPAVSDSEYSITIDPDKSSPYNEQQDNEGLDTTRARARGGRPRGSEATERVDSARDPQAEKSAGARARAGAGTRGDHTGTEYVPVGDRDTDPGVEARVWGPSPHSRAQALVQGTGGEKSARAHDARTQADARAFADAHRRWQARTHAGLHTPTHAERLEETAQALSDALSEIAAQIRDTWTTEAQLAHTDQLRGAEEDQAMTEEVDPDPSDPPEDYTPTNTGDMDPEGEVDPDPPEELREDNPGEVTDLDDWEPMEPAIEDLAEFERHVETEWGGGDT